MLAATYPANLCLRLVDTAKSLADDGLSIAIRDLFTNSGRNIPFGQNVIISMRCNYAAKLTPLRGKPKQRFWHNFARPDNRRV